jgi:hypothetical protein
MGLVVAKDDFGPLQARCSSRAVTSASGMTPLIGGRYDDWVKRLLRWVAMRGMLRPRILSHGCNERAVPGVRDADHLDARREKIFWEVGVFSGRVRPVTEGNRGCREAGPGTATWWMRPCRLEATANAFLARLGEAGQSAFPTPITRLEHGFGRERGALR